MLFLGFAALLAVVALLSFGPVVSVALPVEWNGMDGVPWGFWGIQDLQGRLVALIVGVVAFSMPKLLGFIPNGDLLLKEINVSYSSSLLS